MSNEIRYFKRGKLYHPVNLDQFVRKYADSVVDVEQEFKQKTVSRDQVDETKICNCCNPNNSR